MKIVNREEFLSLDDPVLYVKCDEWGNTTGELSISYGRSGCGEDFVTVALHGFVKKWGGNKSCIDGNEHYAIISEAIKNKDSHFEWDYTMTGRDGLYDKDQLFMVYEKLDLLKLMRELNKIYAFKYHKDDLGYQYEIY